MWSKGGIALGVLAFGAPAWAEQTSPAVPPVNIEVERHFTSNALDEPLAVADWYTSIRGSLDHELAIEDGHVKVGFDFDTRTYDTVSIEDDHAAALRAEILRKLTPTISLREAVRVSVSDLGDDILLGDTAIGTRAATRSLVSDTQLGVDLGGGSSFVLGLVAGKDRTGKTYFDNTLITPTRLDPDRDSVQVTARLARQVSGITYGVFAAAQSVVVEKLGFPPLALGFRQITVAAEAGLKTANAASVNLAVGLQELRGDDDILRELRPTYSFTFVAPLPKGFELHGAATGRFESVDSDDPLGSWLSRGELEAFFRCNATLSFAAGVFAQNKTNLLLENDERSRGVYVKASYELPSNLTFTARIDVSRVFKTVIDERKHTVDAYIGIQKKL